MSRNSRTRSRLHGTFQYDSSLAPCAHAQTRLFAPAFLACNKPEIAQPCPTTYASKARERKGGHVIERATPSRRERIAVDFCISPRALQQSGGDADGLTPRKLPDKFNAQFFCWASFPPLGPEKKCGMWSPWRGNDQHMSRAKGEKTRRTGLRPRLLSKLRRSTPLFYG